MLTSMLEDAKTKFLASIDHLNQEFATIRSSQISPSLVEDVVVNAYDSTFPLKELAAISLPEPNMLLIQPWDQVVVEPIEKALAEAELGAMPSVDGQMIRLSLPTLSEERRNDLAKKVGTLAEEAKISVRNIRQDKMKALDEMEDEGKISEDERDRYRKLVQDEVDAANKRIEELKDNKVSSLKSL